MELTFYHQTVTFLWSLASGVLITLIYIVMETARELSPPSTAVFVAEDIVFMGLAAGINLFLALSRTQGYIRGYVLLSQAAVFAVLYLTLGKLLKHTVRLLIRTAKQISCAVCSPIRRKFGRISEKLSQKCRNLSMKVKKIKK